MDKAKKYTVILIYPTSMSEYSDADSYLAHIMARNASEAVITAQAEAAGLPENDGMCDPGDFNPVCVFCGHLTDLLDNEALAKASEARRVEVIELKDLDTQTQSTPPRCRVCKQPLDEEIDTPGLPYCLVCERAWLNQN